VLAGEAGLEGACAEVVDAAPIVAPPSTDLRVTFTSEASSGFGVGVGLAAWREILAARRRSREREAWEIIAQRFIKNNLDRSHSIIQRKDRIPPPIRR
jgi:hypothetical protein